MTINVTKTDDAIADNARLRALMAAIEARDGVRFAMLDLGDRLVLTTSNGDDAPGPYEMRLYACFAKAWADQQTAFHVGHARGIKLAADTAYGDKWPKSVRKVWDESVEQASVASVTAIDLTRIAMSPFGLEVVETEQALVWREREVPR